MHRIKYCTPIFLFVMVAVFRDGDCTVKSLTLVKRHMSGGTSPRISVSPTSVKVGITNELTATCSIDEDDLEADKKLVSMLISFKPSASKTFNVLGVLTTTDCKRPMHGKFFHGELSGDITDKKGFLTTSITFPDNSALGEYRCQISTKDEYSMFRSTFSPAVAVSSSDITLADLALALSRLRQRVENKFQETDWITIQRRINGDTDFFRNWEEYKHGFGDKKTNFWLGLDKIHELTKYGSELMVKLKYGGKTAFAHYWNFRVGDEASGYKLFVGGYDTGSTAGDNLTHHNKMKFSTKDKDNDTWDKNCAVAFHGAFWYAACHHVNINGKWGAGSNLGLRWLHFTGQNSATYSEMKIRI